jgi:hypothetical protein
MRPGGDFARNQEDKKRRMLMTRLRMTGLALAALLGSALMIGGATGQASAMPANGLAPAAKAIGSGVEHVRWCGPYRCWGPGGYWGRPFWRPYYGVYAYAPGPYWHRPYGWWGWHRPWGWHRGWW